MERVSIIEGKAPVIFVAPHGCDDTNTDHIAEHAANALKAYAVINRGWKRADKYDYDQEHADCNNLHHLQEDVVCDEFLAPIKRFASRIRKKFPWAYMITIHGMGNDAKKKAGDPDLAMVVGYGAGNPPSLTCKPWMKDLFCYQAVQFGWNVYEGKPGGPFSAWTLQNLCQLFRKWQPDPHIHAMQIEIVRDWRADRAKSEFIADCMSEYIGEIINYGNWDTPHGFKVPQF
jgi:hypothetical protein